MSAQEPDAAAAALEPRLGLGSHPALIGTTSSQESHTRQPEAQNQETNVSGSSGSIYHDTSDNDQTGHGLSDVAAPVSQPNMASGHDEAKLKGKEANNAGLEERHEVGGSENFDIDQHRDITQGVHVSGEVNNPESSNSQLTPKEPVKQRLQGGDYHPRYYRLPAVQTDTSPNGESVGSDSTSTTARRLPLTRVHHFGSQDNAEEDMRNFDRFQAVRGNPEQNTDSLRHTLRDPAVMVLEPARPAQKRRQRSNNDRRSLDGSGSNAFAAHPGHLRLSVDEGSSSSSDGNTPLLSQTSSIQTHQHQDQETRSEVVVPRWQPDAEVTICPICGTQFSEYFTITCHPRTYCGIGFFVRKHHCR